MTVESIGRSFMRRVLSGKSLSHARLQLDRTWIAPRDSGHHYAVAVVSLHVVSGCPSGTGKETAVEIHVCFCSDDTDWRPLAAAINSTLTNSKRAWTMRNNVRKRFIFRVGCRASEHRRWMDLFIRLKTY